MSGQLSALLRDRAEYASQFGNPSVGEFLKAAALEVDELEAALAACERERDLFKMHRDTDYAAYQEHLENAAKDSARLDWLATNNADLKHLDPLFDSRHGRYELWVVDAPTFDVCADTPREAIDKAIARATRP